MTTVAILQEVIPQYRIPFFEGLRGALAREGVQLKVGQGRPAKSFATRGDSRILPWAVSLPNRHLRLGSSDLVWMNPRAAVEGADLVIATQEVRQLQNLALWGMHQTGRLKLAWWGHGRDFAKANGRSMSERLKRFMSARAHWWFAYNELSARTVEGFGFPSDRITTVMNSTDTAVLSRLRQEVPPEDSKALRQHLGLGTGPVGIYVGAMAGIKQVPYLLEAALTIRAIHPGFQLLMVGSGPEESSYRKVTTGLPWIHWLGPLFDEAKIQAMVLADLYLLPAWVGLGIVDAFALGLPLVTTDTFPHSVEIDYLHHGDNGWIVRGKPVAAAYGQAVADLLHRPEDLETLRHGCLSSAQAYSLEAMVTNFTSGILQALDAPPLRSGKA